MTIALREPIGPEQEALLRVIGGPFIATSRWPVWQYVSAAAGLAMAFKLIESAQARWPVVNTPHLVALVRAGARFENGELVERPIGHATP
jgi:hypothetical protein